MANRLKHCLFLTERGCLIVSIQSAPEDDELTAMIGYTVELILKDRPYGVILDLTGLDVADSFSIQSLQRLCAVIRLYSVNMVIAGIQPEVAFSIAMRGMALDGVSIAADLTDAFALLGHMSTSYGLRKTTQTRFGQHSRARRPSH